MRNKRRTSRICLALSTDACVSNENLASTSVETFPGTIFRISEPKATSSRSRAASTWSSIPLPCAAVSMVWSSVHVHCLRVTFRTRRPRQSTWHIRPFSKQRESKMGWWWHLVACICRLLLFVSVCSQRVAAMTPTGKVTGVADDDLRIC